MMNEIEKDGAKQFTIILGEYDYALLQQWAFTHSKTPAEFASQIIAARIESNEQMIYERIKNVKESKGKK